MATGIAAFPNRPFNLRIEVWYNWQSGTTASVHTEVWIDKTSPSPTQSGCCSSFDVYLDFVGHIQHWEGGFDFTSGNNFLIHSSDWLATVSIYGDVGAQVYANYDILGYAQTGATYDGVAASAPPPPIPAFLDTITINSMRYGFNSAGDGGSPITSWGVEYANNASFTGATLVSGGSGTITISGLTPGTTYYVRSRGQNAAGVGGWSTVLSATTLPVVPPGITVSPSLSGLSSTMTFSPPGGVSGVTEYNWEWRLAPAGTATAGSTVSNTQVVNGLSPGTIYEYRANAEIGTYTSPWSAWTALLQPNPNTNPGNYFDGATTSGTDTTYAWSGTANNSTSVATGKNVTGWRTFAQGSSASGGSGVVARASGGYVSAFGARVTFTQDATAAGFIGGVDVSGAATVEPNILYYASLYVRLPGRTQRLEGGIAWFTAANSLISITWGDDLVVTSSASLWTRVTASGVAPSNADKAAPVVRDVSGTSWSLWLGGNVMWMDAAMITMGQLQPYFDGDTADASNFYYAWEGTAHASASTRNTLPQVDESDPLADPDCTPIPLPPMPPIIASDCITEVGTWRRYTVQIPAVEVSLWAATLPTMILTTGSVAERQVRIRVYPNPDGLAPEQVNTDVWDAELILTYIPPNTVMTLDSVTQRVRAEISGADPIVANQLLYGTDGVPATWPALRCGIGYVVSLDVPLDAPSGNLTTRVLLTSKV